MRAKTLMFCLVFALISAVAALADELPSKLTDIPIYSGATLVKAYTLSDKGYGSAQYLAPGAVQADVISFYKTALGNANWTLNEESNTDEGGRKLVFERGTELVFVTFNPTQSEFNIEVSIAANI